MWKSGNWVVTVKAACRDAEWTGNCFCAYPILATEGHKHLCSQVHAEVQGSDLIPI